MALKDNVPARSASLFRGDSESKLEKSIVGQFLVSEESGWRFEVDRVDQSRRRRRQEPVLRRPIDRDRSQVVLVARGPTLGRPAEGGFDRMSDEVQGNAALRGMTKAEARSTSELVVHV